MSNWFQSIWQSVVDYSYANPFSVVLLGGIAFLLVTLFIVMRTRVGQTRPIWTCAVLSIFAHILLFGYAYGTQLSMRSETSGDDLVKFRLIELKQSSNDREEVFATDDEDLRSSLLESPREAAVEEPSAGNR